MIIITQHMVSITQCWSFTNCGINENECFRQFKEMYSIFVHSHHWGMVELVPRREKKTTNLSVKSSWVRTIYLFDLRWPWRIIVYFIPKSEAVLFKPSFVLVKLFTITVSWERTNLAYCYKISKKKGGGALHTLLYFCSQLQTRVFYSEIKMLLWMSGDRG